MPASVKPAPRSRVVNRLDLPEQFLYLGCRLNTASCQIILNAIHGAMGFARAAISKKPHQQRKKR